MTGDIQSPLLCPLTWPCRCLSLFREPGPRWNKAQTWPNIIHNDFYDCSISIILLWTVIQFFCWITTLSFYNSIYPGVCPGVLVLWFLSETRKPTGRLITISPAHETASRCLKGLEKTSYAVRHHTKRSQKSLWQVWAHLLSQTARVQCLSAFTLRISLGQQTASFLGFLISVV